MAKGNVPVDLELKKAFAELQQKHLDTMQKLKFADMQIESLKRVIQHTKLTVEEINSLNRETRLYESVGRAFFSSTVRDILQQLEEKTKACEGKIKNHEGNKGYLQRSLKESENNLREMVQQRKESTAPEQS